MITFTYKLKIEEDVLELVKSGDIPKSVIFNNGVEEFLSQFGEFLDNEIDTETKI